jgi:two-component system catabolic regulation response regulator CreB/two-component system response regulator ChvI
MKDDDNDHNGNSRRRRILLVDDEPDITTSLKIGLEDNGFIVHAFNDPLQALSNFKPGLYDLLLFDIMMPELNGFDLYNRIKREKNKDQDLKVCYITAYDINYEQLREKFPSFNINCFIKKPFQISDFIGMANKELAL